MRPSGYLTRPDYRIDLVPLPVVVQARTPSRLIAATRHAVRLDEQNHEPVVYFPSTSVDLAALVPMPERTTHCPYKGDARYWALPEAPDVPVAWSYPEVYPEVAGIAGMIAFYAERIEVTR